MAEIIHALSLVKTKVKITVLLTNVIFFIYFVNIKLATHGTYFCR